MRSHILALAIYTANCIYPAHPALKGACDLSTKIVRHPPLHAHHYPAQPKSAKYSPSHQKTILSDAPGSTNTTLRVSKHLPLDQPFSARLIRHSVFYVPKFKSSKNPRQIAPAGTMIKCSKGACTMAQEPHQSAPAHPYCQSRRGSRLADPRHQTARSTRLG